ncbi:MAG: hypothetical protein H0W83_04085 [Planctomycetes bacterium]|nr:hypothetical protein [Planctomycetota bacterium]
MVRSSALLVLIALTASNSALAESESKLSFADLRVQAGVADTTGPSAAITLMCGDIGNANQHAIDVNEDLGIVLGVRGTLLRTDMTVLGTDITERLVGGEFLIGLGIYAGPRDHVELAGGYHIGVLGASGDNQHFRKNGTYRGFGGELGWYHTWKSHLQFGLLAGYSARTVRVDITDGSRASVNVNGLDAAISLGYRF